MATIYVDDTASIAWPTSTLVSVGDRVFGSGGEQVIFECTTGGTTGGSEPAWDTTPGNTTNDNGAVWTARNFDSWLNASPSLDNAAVDGAAAGSEIWVASTHDESIAAFITLAFVNATRASPIIIKSINTSDDTYLVGAKIATSGSNNILWQGQIYIFGIVTDSSNSIECGTNGNDCYFEDAVFTTVDDFRLFGQEGSCEYKNSTFTIGDTAGTGAFNSSQKGSAHLSGCTVTHPNTGTLLREQPGTRFLFEDCDLSASSTNIISGMDQPCHIVLRRCKLKASWTPLAGGSISQKDGSILVEGCTSTSPITDPELGLTQLDTLFGTIKSTLAVYRTGGANDGENANAHSWEMATNANASEQYRALECLPITRWVDPDTTPSGATSKGIVTSTRMAIQGTPAPLTTDGSSTWNGSGVGTKQKITHTLNNQDGATLTLYVASAVTLNDDDFWLEVHEPDQVGGPITVKCFLADPRRNSGDLGPVYVDPKLEVA